jgi:SlyX protein
MSEERVIELEIKLAHHELALEELQRAYYEQEKAIAKLTATVELLGKRLEGSAGLEIGPANERPPHY